MFGSNVLTSFNTLTVTITTHADDHLFSSSVIVLSITISITSKFSFIDIFGLIFLIFEIHSYSINNREVLGLRSSKRCSVAKTRPSSMLRVLWPAAHSPLLLPESKHRDKSPVTQKTSAHASHETGNSTGRHRINEAQFVVTSYRNHLRHRHHRYPRPARSEQGPTWYYLRSCLVPQDPETDQS